MLKVGEGELDLEKRDQKERVCDIHPSTGRATKEGQHEDDRVT